MNRFAKFLLVSTALSPILGAVAVNQIARGQTWTSWSPWLGVALLLVLGCQALLVHAAKNVQKQRICIKEFERNDQEVLAFLLAYMLPFVSSANMIFADDWLTSVYILGIIYLVIAHADALHFNPVMGLLRYHFYAVKNAHNISHLLISKRKLLRPGKNVQTVRLTHNIYLDIGGTGA